MNAQECFNLIVLQMMAQGEPSISKDKACAYRGLEGRKCAAGHLLPDKDYDPTMEGRSFASLVESNLVSLKFDHPSTVEMIQMMQKAHDNAGRKFFVQDFRTEARRVAEIFRLDTSVLDKTEPQGCSEGS